MTNFKIIQKRTVWLGISLAMFIIFGGALIKYGLNFGIDFTGGSVMEVRFTGERPSNVDIQKVIEEDKALGGVSSLVVQPVGDKNMIIRFKEITEEKHKAVFGAIKNYTIKKDSKGSVEELSFDSVGPSVGQELRSNAMWSIFWVLLLIVCYIAYAFRKVSKPVASWKYGLASVIALSHDAIITLGIFALLGKFKGVEINTPFVTAILTVVGYSNHDTIVVFDRVRENLPKSHDDFAGTVNTSLNQTLMRSINTSLTVILTLAAVYLYGGKSIQSFALALLIGIGIGTYSSIFVASPLLVVWDNLTKKK